MKQVFALLLSLHILTTTCAQVITYNDFRTVIPLLLKEDFKGVFDKTDKLLNSTLNDSSDLRGIVTYMNIFSAAGLVSIDEMSYDSFTQNINKYIGQYIVMPAHPCIDSSARGYNSLQFVTGNKGNLQGMTTTVNAAKTNILCFEYFDYAASVNPTDFMGKDVRCGGILQTAETNPNKSKIWIAKLHITDAFARVITTQ